MSSTTIGSRDPSPTRSPREAIRSERNDAAARAQDAVPQDPTVRLVLALDRAIRRAFGQLTLDHPARRDSPTRYY